MGHSGRAVVLGAGVAGLLAAHRLTNHYHDVVIVERDALPESVEDRRGVAQGRHVHALLARGQQVLEEAFPGISDELASAGAHVGDLLEHARLYFSGHRLQPAATGLTVISASRALLEHHLRARVLALAQVEVIERCDAAGLVADRDRGRITGVRLLRRVADSADEVLGADLVVDATGRNTRSPAWLVSLGIEPPVEQQIPVDVAYASRRYRMPADSLDGDIAVISAATPTNPRTGALALLEADTGLLTLAGISGDRPPLDPCGFHDFARTVVAPDIAEAVRDAQPLDDPVPHRFPASTWRRYDRCRGLPDGFALIGDGVCSINPIYGQGMTIAALEAYTLDQQLRLHGRLRSRRFQREIAGIIRPAWQLAAGADLQFPGVEGPRTRRGKALGAYVQRLHAAAAHDPKLSEAFMRVSGFVDSPPSLLRPAVAARVLTARRPPRAVDPPARARA